MRIYRLSKENNWILAFNVNKGDVRAKELTNEMLNIIQENVGRNSYEVIKIDDQCNLDFSTFYHNQNSLPFPFRYENFDIRANTNVYNNNLVPPEIQFVLRFTNNFSQADFQRLYYVILDGIRHELTHYKQYKNEKENLNENVQNQERGFSMLDSVIQNKNYLLSQMENEAYINGLILLSKKRNVPFERVLCENLNGIIFNNNEDLERDVMASEDWQEINKIILEIRQTIINKARQIYPFIKNRENWGYYENHRPRQ